jgi:hypothetical protein
MKRVVLKKAIKTNEGMVYPSGIAMNYDKKTKSVQHPTNSNFHLVVKKSQIEEVKNYVILGDNNFWYSTTGETTKKSLHKEIETVMEGIKNGSYETASEPTELHVFETASSAMIDL